MEEEQGFLMRVRVMTVKPGRPLDRLIINLVDWKPSLKTLEQTHR
jgi:hypothetical protein